MPEYLLCFSCLHASQGFLTASCVISPLLTGIVSPWGSSRKAHCTLVTLPALSVLRKGEFRPVAVACWKNQGVLSRSNFTERKTEERRLCNPFFFFSYLCEMKDIPFARGQTCVMVFVVGWLSFFYSAVSLLISRRVSAWRPVRGSLQPLCLLTEVEEGKGESTKRRCVWGHSFHVGSETSVLVVRTFSWPELKHLTLSRCFYCIPSTDVDAAWTGWSLVTGGPVSDTLPRVGHPHRLDSTVRMSTVISWIYIYIYIYWEEISGWYFLFFLCQNKRHWTCHETKAQVLVLEPER